MTQTARETKAPPDDLARRVEESVAAIRSRWATAPRVGVILGTGLGGLAAELETEAVFSFDALPHFPRATAPAHRGQLSCGRLWGVPVMMMDGRLHAYEGYSLAETTFPVRVMRGAGVQTLVISNAAGGLNPRFATGDVMLIDDHINLMAGNPLVGQHHERVGPRFPDLSNAYDPRLVRLALEVARRENISLYRGVYVAVTGPNYETRAEYRFLRRIGGDAIGMSTAAEVIVASQCGLRVLALSTITNVCLPDALTPTRSEDVVRAARQARNKVQRIVRGVLERQTLQTPAPPRPHVSFRGSVNE